MLTAQQASKITGSALRELFDVVKWVDAIDRRIIATAKTGGNAITRPLCIIPELVCDEVTIRLIKEHYTKAGFTWNNDGTLSWPAMP
jgi:hypothetical protein